MRYSMLAKDYRDLFLLAAIWGSSFLFMRLSVGDFGPLALVEVRVGLGALVLLAVAGLRGQLGTLRRHGPKILFCGIFAAGLPFLCFNFAVQTVPTGLVAVINAMTPLFGALIARIWLKERLSRSRIAGLMIGFIGIVVLVGGDLSSGPSGMTLGVLACLAAAFCYGFAACFTTRYLKGLDPIAVAAGSITGAAIALFPFAVMAWPEHPVSLSAWAAATALALLCTGVAYIIFYGLVDRVGATRSITVTFLVPLFGVLWGTLLLDEPLTTRMVAGTAIVLLGTLLATGFIQAAKTQTAS